MSRNLHEGHRARMRARYRSAPESFRDHEILEILLYYALPQKDTNELAHRLLERFGSLSGVLEAQESQLAAVEGMGATSAMMFPVIADFLRRYLKEKNSRKPVVGDVLSSSLGTRYAAEYLGLNREIVMLVGLDKELRVVGDCVIGEGNFDSAAIDLQKTAEFVHRTKPNYVVMTHNHPSGVGLPSSEDYAATDRVADFVSHLGVRLIDHLIFDGSGDYISFRDSGFLRKDASRPDYRIVIREPDPLTNVEPFPDRDDSLFSSDSSVTKMQQNGSDA